CEIRRSRALDSAQPRPAAAAIRFDREPDDAAAPRPFGRLAAGEGFLRGFLAHADLERFHLWNAENRPQAELEALLERLGAPTKPGAWIGGDARLAFTAP